MMDEREAALQLFEGLRGELPGLRIEIDSDGPNDVIDVEIPEQPGLDFRVHLDFQNADELHLCAGDVFWCSWFPSSDAEVSNRYRAAVLGVLSGQYRIVEYWRWGRGVGAHLQAPGPGGWRTVGASRSGVLGALPLRWRTAERVVQNRAPSNNELQRTRPAQAVEPRR